jgi:hypothetical protein
MSAVDLTRLRFQIEDLLALFPQPAAFHSGVNALFNRYSNRSLRFGELSQTKPLIPMYHLPGPVMRQMVLELTPLIREEPQAALAIVDELWKDDYFEVKKLAIHILGLTPIDNPQIIRQRIEDWLSPDLDGTLVASIFSVGVRQLQSKFPETWEAIIQSYLYDRSPKMIRIGIQGLEQGVRAANFDNLPVVLRLVSPLIQAPHPDTNRRLEKLIEALIQHSPTETVFFLKQMLSTSDRPETLRLIKACLPSLPDALREDLKSAIKHHSG